MDPCTAQGSGAVARLCRPGRHGQRASASERRGSVGVLRTAADTHHVSIDLISKDGHALS